MEKQPHAQQIVGWNYLSIPKLLRLWRWNLGIDKFNVISFHALQRRYLPIHAEIAVNPCYHRGSAVTRLKVAHPKMLCISTWVVQCQIMIAQNLRWPERTMYWRTFRLKYEFHYVLVRVADSIHRLHQNFLLFYTPNDIILLSIILL